MVILIETVFGDAVFGFGMVARVVVEGEADYGFCIWKDLARVDSAVRVTFEPFHVASGSIGKPLVESIGVCSRCCFGKAACIKANFLSNEGDVFFELLRRLLHGGSVKLVLDSSDEKMR